MMGKVVALCNFIRYQWFFRNSGFFYILAFPSIKGINKIQLGKHFYANRFLRMEVLGNDDRKRLFIGNNVSLGESVHLASFNRVVIEDNVLMGSRILVTDHNHGRYNGSAISDPDLAPQEREVFSDGPVIIEQNVWIGDGVVILPNVTIGRSSIIGANSVVTSSIPSYSIAGGVPARVLKRYNFESKQWDKV